MSSEWFQTTTVTVSGKTRYKLMRHTWPECWYCSSNLSQYWTNLKNCCSNESNRHKNMGEQVQVKKNLDLQTRLSYIRYIVCDQNPTSVDSSLREREVTCNNMLWHTDTHTRQARQKYAGLDGRCGDLERGLRGGYKGLVQHINQPWRCVCVPVLSVAPGLG